MFRIAYEIVASDSTLEKVLLKVCNNFKPNITIDTERALRVIQAGMISWQRGGTSIPWAVENEELD